MKLLNIDYVPGKEIEDLGIVKGTVVHTKNVGKDFMAAMKTHWTGALGHNTDFPSAMRNYLKENLPLYMNHRIYFDNGDCPYDTVYIPYFNQMVELVDSLGYNSDQFKHSIFPGHSHDEKSWSRRVATPLEFLLAH